jgi:hypothetical protein
VEFLNHPPPLWAIWLAVIWCCIKIAWDLFVLALYLFVKGWDTLDNFLNAQAGSKKPLDPNLAKKITVGIMVVGIIIGWFFTR